MTGSDRPYRILMLHNAYQVRGGEEESAESEVRMLRDAGHHVTYLTAHNDSINGPIAAAKTAALSVWNPSWYRRVSQALETGSYDILHVQNTFPQISPAVYAAARRHGVPVVQAVRNYRYACPSATLLRDGALCSDCVGRRVKLPALRHRCYRGSLGGSATVAAISAAHHLLGTWHRQVDRYLAISQSVVDLLEAEGFPKDKIRIKPCFTFARHTAADPGSAPRRDVLFVGRLSEEKGVPLLLEAWARLAPKHTRLNIIGEGDVARTGVPNVTFLGRKSPQEVQRAMAEATCVVMPGTWAEPFGRVAVEAFCQATPVIATNIGGVADIVQDGHTGFLFPQGDADALARAIGRYLSDTALARAHGQAARERYLEWYTPEANLAQMEQIYAEVLADHRAQNAGQTHRPSPPSPADCPTEG